MGPLVPQPQLLLEEDDQLMEMRTQSSQSAALLQQRQGTLVRQVPLTVLWLACRLQATGLLVMPLRWLWALTGSLPWA